MPIGVIGLETLDVAVDAERDRIYVASQGNIGAGLPSVTVLHRPSRTIVATGPAHRARPPDHA